MGIVSGNLILPWSTLNIETFRIGELQSKKTENNFPYRTAFVDKPHSKLSFKMPESFDLMRFINPGIILLTLIAACKSNEEKASSLIKFKKPTILQAPTEDSISYYKFDFIIPHDPIYRGKRKFSDSIVDPRQHKTDTSFHKDCIESYSIYEYNSLITNGFELVPDYTSKIHYNPYSWSEESKHSYYYYPVYIINPFGSTKTLFCKDSHIFGIQEAQDKNGIWRPIESKGFDFCGNGHWAINVRPQEYVTVLFPIYSGNYKTKLRIRIKNSDFLYVSQPFDGTIDEKQFYLSKEEFQYLNELENKLEDVKRRFFGAIPIELSH
jgi:hypothetical protein